MLRVADPRSGFTLVEVVVALLLGVVVIAGARAVLATVGDSALRVEASSIRHDSDASGARLFEQLVLNTQSGTTADFSFNGGETSANFSSWCREARGWAMHCRVLLSFQGTGPSRELVAKLSTGESVPLLSVSNNTRLAYLISAEGGGTWLKRWDSGVRVPLAIGLLSSSDTIVARIGLQQ